MKRIIEEPDSYMFMRLVVLLGVVFIGLSLLAYNIKPDHRAEVAEARYEQAKHDLELNHDMAVKMADAMLHKSQPFLPEVRK